MNTIPEKCNAVILPEYNDNLIRALLGMNYMEVSLPVTEPDEVLVKMAAATCNPSDIAFIRGGYNVKKILPAIPGFEASGVVVEAGKESNHLLGARVSCVVQEDKSGAWSEYIVAKAANCIVLKDGISFEQGACIAINPLTAIGLFDLVKKRECKAIVQNAAGGQVAEFIRILAAENDISVISIVRKEEQAEYLKGKGIQYVLNSSKEDFAEQLKILCFDLNTTMAFDAVGGEMTARLLNSMPPGSDVVIYGGLSGSRISGIDEMGLIFRRKKLYGFNLKDWSRSMSREKFEDMRNLAQDKIVKGEFKTKIQATFKLEEAVNAIRTYIKSMSGGKIIFHP